jgi:hypothetical protein
MFACNGNNAKPWWRHGRQYLTLINPRQAISSCMPHTREECCENVWRNEISHGLYSV